MFIFIKYKKIIMETGRKSLNETGNEIFCGLCVSIVRDENFTVIENTIKEVLDVLFLKLNVEEVGKSVMCNACSVKLFEAFHFKVMCTDTEDSISPYVHSESKTAIDLVEIYLKQRGKEHLKDILEDERICRLCMQVVTCGFTPVKEMDVDTFCRYIPEVNFKSTREPVICKDCLNLLNIHTSFLNNLLNTKQEINICDNDALENLSTIKCEEVDIKPDEIYRDELVNCTSESNSKFVKMNNGCMPKGKRERHASKTVLEKLRRHLLRHKNHTYKCDSCDFKTTYKCNLVQHHCDYKTKRKPYFTRHLLIHKDTPEDQMYKCASCDYKTKRKPNLTQHLLVHKNIPEEQMNKCDSCDYKTKQKYDFAQHMLRHKDIPEYQMHKCDSCEYKTKDKYNIARHQLRHRHPRGTDV